MEQSTIAHPTLRGRIRNMSNIEQVLFAALWLGLFAVLFVTFQPLAYAQALAGFLALVWLRLT